MRMLSAALVALIAATMTITAHVAWGQAYTSAYDPRWQDSLWNEAIALQENGEHAQAIKRLRRAGHLSRINEGLNAKSQLLYLRAEIASHRALNQLELADERQLYLSRIEATVVPSGPEKISALLAQGEWHQYALLQAIDDNEGAAVRMQKAWNFYLRARDESLTTYGETSELIPALEGMIRNQYINAARQGVGAALPGQMNAFGQTNGAPRSIFKRGLPVFLNLQQLKRDRLGVSREMQADDLILMGDWAWWTGNRGYALDFYNSALALANGNVPREDTPEGVALLQEESAPEGIQIEESSGDQAPTSQASQISHQPNDSQAKALNAGPVGIPVNDVTMTVEKPANQPDSSLNDARFSILESPVPLPAVEGFEPVLPIKESEASEQDLIVTFNVSKWGKAINIQRIQDPVVEDSAVPRKIIRRLRSIRFRPAFVNGEPAESQTITWIFDLNTWSNSGKATKGTAT
jgi:hypothetical protein